MSENKATDKAKDNQRNASEEIDNSCIKDIHAPLPDFDMSHIIQEVIDHEAKVSSEFDGTSTSCRIY